jgi:hypothetical protein
MDDSVGLNPWDLISDIVSIFDGKAVSAKIDYDERFTGGREGMS